MTPPRNAPAWLVSHRGCGGGRLRVGWATIMAAVTEYGTPLVNDSVRLTGAWTHSGRRDGVPGGNTGRGHRVHRSGSMGALGC